MAKSVIVDAGVLVALVRRRDRCHRWATAQAKRWSAPWLTCEAALSEAFFLAGVTGRNSLSQLLRRKAVEVRFDLASEHEPVLALMERYSNVPMSLADACIVRMTETLADPLVLTTDSDFHVYRRHSRQVVPCLLP